MKIRYLILAGIIAGCGGAKEARDDLSKAIGVSQDSSDGEGEQTGESDHQVSPTQLTGSLSQFANCKEVEDHIEERQIESMRRTIDRQIYYLQERQSDLDESEPMANEAAADSASGSSEDKASGPEDYTTTNNQVDGVEEADFVKNTGTHIYQLSHGKLRILRSWPVTELAELASIDIPGRARQMVLAKDKIIVFGHAPKEVKNEPVAQDQLGLLDSVRPGYYYSTHTQVTVIDIADPAEPKVLESTKHKGRYMDARRVGSDVRLVVSDRFNRPAKLQHYIPWQDAREMSISEKIALLEDFKIENEKIIRDMSFKGWIANTNDVESLENTKEPEESYCQAVFAPDFSTTPGLTKIITVNTESLKTHQTTLLARVNELYANKKSLYLNTAYHWWDWRRDHDNYSYIHKFDLSESGKTTYLGSGGVRGHLLNQFAMDDHDGFLRVATTYRQKGGSWDDTVNRIYVMEQEGGELKVIGKTEELAKGERIYAVRFMGERGYVVTFRQVDPLFTLDLKDPKDPKVVGELKIPGFSNYMQVIDENHILAIGRDGDWDGRVNGLKLSIFDVTDFAKPVEEHQHVIEGGGWSEASYEHKAFTYFAARGKLAIPAWGRAGDSGRPYYYSYRSQLKVFDVDLENGFSHLGNVELNDAVDTDKEIDSRWWRSNAVVRRSIFADDYVYAITNMGITVRAVDSLEEEVATTRYECEGYCWNWYY